MSDVIELDDGARVDVASQKILVRLNPKEWTYTGELQAAAELSQNGQVLYRLVEHLIPAGLVEEGKRRREQDTRRFRLTRDGSEWLETHQEEVAHPASRAETQEMAFEALDAAESAKESVQNYRRKVYRLKQRIEELEALEERVAENATKLESHSGSISGLRDTKADSASVTNFGGEFVKFRDEMEQKHAEAIDRLDDRLDAQDRAISELRAEIATVREENEQLRTDFEEWTEQGPVHRLLGDD